MSKRRCSRQIVLVLIGTAALPACTPTPQRVVHDRYASLEDCSADWGRPVVCDRENNPSPMAGNFGGPRVFYRGPSYPEGDRGEAQTEARRQALRLGVADMPVVATGSHAIQQSVPSRGGFGSSAHFFGRLG